MVLSSYAFRKVYVKDELFLQLLDAVQLGLGTWNLKLIFVYSYYSSFRNGYNIVIKNCFY